MWLEQINKPEDLRKLSKEELIFLCQEIRKVIIEKVAKEGGHLGASLGAVEITVALHYVFDAPNDAIIFDVGHQAYPHKLLTGRRNTFDSLRKKDGISGFPKRSESVFDAFGTGHSSTSLSAIAGMAKAAELLGKNNFHIAVIGDGAMTAGMTFEALQQMTAIHANILIILNDNGMSIDANTGSLHKHFQDLQQGFSPSIFEILGLKYEGIIDGHQLDKLIFHFDNFKKVGGIKVLHCKTTKGKGYEMAENSQTIWHSPPKFDALTGEKIAVVEKRKFQDVFGDTLIKLAQENENLVVVTPAMKSGSGLLAFEKLFPKRIFDVAIAEQHAVTFSAGMVAAGLKVFCSIYSTFLQRGYDQVIHDVCLQNLPVVFCIDRAGLVGSDGATHHGLYDLAYLRCLPNAVVCAPMCEDDFVAMLNFASNYTESPIFVRYPRGNVPNFTAKTISKTNIDLGKGVIIREGYKIALLTFGIAGIWAEEALDFLAKQDIFPSHANLRFLKPLDNNLLNDFFEKHDALICIEDGSINGGFGEAVISWANAHGFTKKIIILAVPDKIIEHGEVNELREECGLDLKSIVDAVTLNYL